MVALRVSRRDALAFMGSGIALTSLAACSGPPQPAPTIAAGVTLQQLVAKYRHLELTDTHNHDASRGPQSVLGMWEKNGVARVVLFGDVSDPSAVATDEAAWEAYLSHPDLIVPLFSGFNLHDESCLGVVRSNLERGFFGLGEIAGASTYSPALEDAEWKADHPMDGYLPQIYELCAEYRAPILLHIDPPSGPPLARLEEALDSYPDTTFIFAHINAYNAPENALEVMGRHDNLFADFFAGFTALNISSANELSDFLPVARAFPERFLLSSDSGYALPSEEAAVESMYRFIDLIDDPVLARNVAHDNFARLIDRQTATATQLGALREHPEFDDTLSLSKAEAGSLLAVLQS